MQNILFWICATTIKKAGFQTKEWYTGSNKTVRDFVVYDYV